MLLVTQCPSDSATPQTVARQALCPWNSPGKNTAVGSLLQGIDLPNPGIKPRSPALQADSLLSEPPGKWPPQLWRQASPYFVDCWDTVQVLLEFVSQAGGLSLTGMKFFSTPIINCLLIISMDICCKNFINKGIETIVPLKFYNPKK